MASRYEVERGRLRDGGWSGSTWWRDITRIREGSELGGNWFGEYVSKRVGDGLDTFFWNDPWVEGIPLCERFGRLFDLAENKERMVVEMFSLGWGWMGRCGSGGGNRWQWQPNPDEGYTVRGAYQHLTSHVTHKNKPGYARHLISCSSLLRFWLWEGRVGPSPIHLLQNLWTPLDFSMLVDRRHPGVYHFHTRSLCSVYMFGRWISGAAFLYAAHLAGVCLGRVDEKKSLLISRLNRQFPSVAGQDRAFLF
ncbi:hypothetical protein TSUD_93780 [Trifolium subterraneum]|uniref:Reverse transcriptase zinc-binding domain-containing protein n=1 Tax=Trifolium subterraneum TaxID=3900 RepID=A0A2Z6NQ88_TRISU|nr:hypothetical protein TSUD_93780 [Trifolium subterraneum]